MGTMAILLSGWKPCFGVLLLSVCQHFHPGEFQFLQQQQPDCNKKFSYKVSELRTIFCKINFPNEVKS